MKVKDAAVHGPNIYLIDELNKVHCFNIEINSLVRTDLTPLEAVTLPYHEKMNLFSNFLIYDYKLLYTHGPILTAIDLNATIYKRNSQRHFYLKTENENTEPVG